MRRVVLAVAGLLVGVACLVPTSIRAQAPATAQSKAQAKPQPRPAGEKIKVDPATITVDDGDSVVIKWPSGDEEIVRILGIDSPEVRHVEHNIPFDQPHGPEARAFAQGAFAVANDVQILRSATLDPYGRSLAYMFVDGKNYSILTIKARLSSESVSIYGDNGLPEIAAEVTAAAKAAGPPAFEPPGAYRSRMRTQTEWMKKSGTYPDK
ncbi:MAG TPA: thermonuclease family protein [Isosphaeraceae bacterium]|jgi:endonuclease YncB( thermonuclease family)